MRTPTLSLRALAGIVFFGCAATCSAQTGSTTDLTTPGFVKMQPIEIHSIQPFSADMTLVFPANADTSRDSSGVGSDAAGAAASENNAGGNRSANNNNPNGNLSGLVTVPTFVGAFAAEGGPSLGTVFPFIMIGNHPLLGGNTVLPAKITAVSVQLLNADGSVFKTLPYAPFEDLTEDSPNFSDTTYSSSNNPTQFADAVQRAEFFNAMGANWHTKLDPSFVDRVTIQIPKFVRVRLPNGTIVTVQAYFAGTAPDGTPFVEVLDLLFNSLNFNADVNEIINNTFTTDAINFTLYPNTFLFSINSQGKFASCCVIGFHNYIFEQGVTPQPRWISLFASWISPGLFRGGVQDVTALSHEISEAFNDPFGSNAVPSWQFPGVPANARVCQGNLETGDPVELLPNTTVTLNVKERHQIFSYHPQTEALLQWFEMGTSSDALGGAFSYPNTTALTNSAVPCPQ